MNAQALPNSQSTALWRGEAETGSNRYFSGWHLLVHRISLGHPDESELLITTNTTNTSGASTEHRDTGVYKLAWQLPSQRSK